MVKSMYDYIGDQWKKPDISYQSPQQLRLIKWRKEENFSRIEKPTRIDRARNLGYKAKPGYTIVRAHVRRGGLRKHTIRKGRKPSAKGISKITMGKNTQRIAEERTAKRYPNMEVLNSYWVGADGKNYKLTGLAIFLIKEEYFVEEQVLDKEVEDYIKKVVALKK